MHVNRRLPLGVRCGMRKCTVLIAMLLLALTACGDDDGEDAASTSAVPTTTTIASTTSSTAAAPVTVSCQPVAFTPNSEDAASDIKATGLSCADAEAFVRKAGQQTSSGGPASVDVDGYHCARTRSVEDPLPQAFYECTKGSSKVTFVRS